MRKFNAGSNHKAQGTAMVDVKELLKYNEEVRHRYFETFTKLPWEEFTKNREASFHSIRNIFLHSLEAIDYWLNFLQRKDFGAHKKFGEYESFEEVKSYMENVEKRMLGYLNSSSSAKLSEIYTVNDDSGRMVEVTAEDVLIHVFEEEVHHRGELIALLWQMGVEPPSMSWKGI
jgi:uncharacterized damage-inducible protein DinB